MKLEDFKLYLPKFLSSESDKELFDSLKDFPNKKLLQIEKASGVEYSEKYLIGFLEEKNRSYVEYINDLFTEYERSQKTDEPIDVEERGFFKRFFGIL